MKTRILGKNNPLEVSAIGQAGKRKNDEGRTSFSMIRSNFNNPWLLADFLADIHSVGVATQLTSKAALVIAGFLNPEFLHPLEGRFPAVGERLEAGRHNKPGAVGSIGIDDHTPFARTIVTTSQQKKNHQ